MGTGKEPQVCREVLSLLEVYVPLWAPDIRRTSSRPCVTGNPPVNALPPHVGPAWQRHTQAEVLG